MIAEDHTDVVNVENCDARRMHSGQANRRVQTVKRDKNHSHKIINQTIIMTLLYWLIIKYFAHGINISSIPLLRHYPYFIPHECTRDIGNLN